MEARPDPWPVAIDELLPRVVFNLAEKYPDITYAEYFKDPVNIAEGYRKVSYKTFANAINALAWWMDENIGKPAKADGSETLVFFGVPDLRFGIVTFASLLVGYKCLCPSPRYGADAIAKLIGQVDGNIMLLGTPAPPVYQEVLKHRPMKTVEIPSLDSLLAATPAAYPYSKTYAQHSHEPFLSLHTSGTTGFPKPILYTHEWTASRAAAQHLEVPTGTVPLYAPHARAMSLFPPFHSSGIIAQTIMSPVTGIVNIFPPLAQTPQATVNATVAALEFLGDEPGRKANWIALPPLHAEYLGSNAEVLDKISARVSTAIFGGGDIPDAAGNAIQKKMGLRSVMGSTEVGMYPRIFTKSSLEKRSVSSPGDVQDEWRYMQFDPRLNLRFEPVGESKDGTMYASVVVRNSEKDWEQPIFKINTHADKQEFREGDMYLKHPTKPGLWKHYGRVDDVLVFSSSENFHPIVAERTVQAIEDVEEVMMVGMKKPRAALIVRLNENGKMENVLQVVDEINKTSPIYASVAKDMILVVKEPFLRTAKGSVQKKAMLELYAKELDDLYQRSASTP